MKKIIIIIAVSVLVIIAIIAAIGFYKFNFTNSDIYLQTGGRIDSKDATYLIDGQSITLKGGVSEIEVEPGSSFKKITRYFGNDAKGDLNGDGKEDVAFLLTQDEGGSGTFYYLAVALATEKGYEGVNAVMLGDRIAPQTTEIADGRITVNYADRRADEPMIAAPTVAVSKFFKVVDGNLVGAKNVLSLTNRDWKWVNTKMNNDEIITPKKADAFSINLKDDGSINGKTDCNGFFGKYELIENKLSFSGMGSTMMFCEGSQEAIFTKSLGEVESYFIDKDNKLILQIKLDSGVMMFE
ncbi:MAG: META domain-containing protein [Candidatus Falkowbacteria bacterium]